MAWFEVALLLLSAAAIGTGGGSLLSRSIGRFVRRRRLLSGYMAPSPAAPADPGVLAPPAQHTAVVIPAESSDGQFYEGRLELAIAPPIDSGQVLKFHAHLSTVPDLKVVSLGGSSATGVIITVVLDRPIPLSGILNGMSVPRGTVRADTGHRVALELVHAS